MKTSLFRALLPWLAAAVVALFGALAIRSQTPAPARFAADRMDTFLYGAAFYEEYMPEDRLEKDVQLMEQAGINVVRVGESTWSLWEPEDGRFEFAWMDRIVERLARAHIRVIMGTPTYSIPPWMFKEHPEILVTRLDGRRPLTACARTWTSPTRIFCAIPSASFARSRNTIATIPP